jgi:glutaredoxin
LKAYLSARGIEYEDRDVSQSMQSVRELLAYKSRSTPTTVIGDEVIIGFDRDRIDRLLAC